VVQTIVPSYRSSMQNYGPLVEREGNVGKYVKFTIDGLEKMLSTLFMPRPRRAVGLPNQALDWEDYQ
jgi:exocyst complex component 7